MVAKDLFVVSPIGPKGSSTRKRSDQLLKGYIKPAAKKCGYKADRGDYLHSRRIMESILRQLETASMVVAYVGGGEPWNANVMLEAGYRMAIGLPIMFIRDTDAKLPFDLLDYRVMDFPPFETLRIKDDDRDEGLIEELKEGILINEDYARWESSYAVTEIMMEHDTSIKKKDRRQMFIASSSHADQLFHVEDGLARKPISAAFTNLKSKVDVRQWAAFIDEQNKLIGQVAAGQAFASSDASPPVATVPFVFKKGKDAKRAGVELGYAGKAYLPIIVHYWEQSGTLVLKMLYYDVTGALKRKRDHVICDLSTTEESVADLRRSVR